MTRRLVVAWLLFTALVLGSLVLPLGISASRRQLDDLTTAVLRDAFTLATYAEDGLEAADEPTPSLSAQSSARLGSVASTYAKRSGGRVVVVDAKGVAVLDTDDARPTGRSFSSRPEIASALKGEVTTGTRRSSTLGSGIVYVAVPVASSGDVYGAVRVTFPTAAVDRRIRQYWLTLGVVSLLSLVSALVVALLFARWVTGPIRMLRTVTGRFGSGALDARADSHLGPPEVRDLAVSFNRMAGRLQDAMHAQDAFVADASHQLRSPLTALRLRLENLEAEHADDETAGEATAALLEVQRLSRLVDGLLALARADRTVGKVDLCALRPLLEERAGVWGPLAEDRGIRLVVDGDAAAAARVDPDRVAQIVDNYLANAIDASPDGSTIRLAVAVERGERCLHVVDQGPGLSPEQRARAFDRFWRAPGTSGQSRSGESLGGSGLGLAIVAKLAVQDGGRAALEAAPGGGIDAAVRYPAPG